MNSMIKRLFPLWWLVLNVAADISVFFNRTHHELDVEFRDLPARFGSPIPFEGVRAFLVYADPADACNASALNAPNTTIPNFTGRWAILLSRFNCTFEDKVRNAQKVGYDIVIVHNVNSSELEPMSANDPRGIHVFALFVSEHTGLILRDNYQWGDGYYIKVDDNSPFDINTHLLVPFALFVGICFCTMLGVMIVKCYKDHRRARRHRLPSSSLKKIPIAKFRRGDPYETCAICLDDFVEDEKLRILPCSHAYHCKCVDPWLTRNRRVCPVCKRKVFAADEVRPVLSDTDSDSEVDDRTPLVRASGHATQGGTFSSPSLINALRRPGSGRRHSAPDAGGVVAGPSNSAPSIQHPDTLPVVATTSGDQGPAVVLAANVMSTNPFDESEANG